VGGIFLVSLSYWILSPKPDVKGLNQVTLTKVQTLSQQSESVATSQVDDSPRTDSGQKSSESVKKPMLPEEVFRTFKNQVGLDLDLPGAFSFHELDLDANVAGLFGFDQSQQLGVGVFAYPGQVNDEQALAFVGEARSSIAKWKDLPQQPFTPGLDLKPENGSGVSKLQHYFAPSVAGQSLHVVVVTRSDGRGMYLLVANGPNSLFDENEGYFERARESLKAGDIGAKP
jgi:hypothetical protein